MIHAICTSEVSSESIRKSAFRLACACVLPSAMPLDKGFRGQVLCPSWLLNWRLWPQGAVIIPFANRYKGQANRLYTQPPGGVGGFEFANHTDLKLDVIEFGLEELYVGMQRKLFLYAKVEYPDYPDPLYINVWQSASRYSPGTLYCALEWNDTYGVQCLCSKCRCEWCFNGWICPMLQWD